MLKMNALWMMTKKKKQKQKKQNSRDKMRLLLSWDLLFCMVDMVRLSLLVTYIIWAKMTPRCGSLSN